ncbi:MAG: AAA family ATPase [Vulcanimicrobiaceae bacterium]
MFGIVAITGSIGSGKTTVARLLESELDAVRLSSDELRRDLCGSVIGRTADVFNVMCRRMHAARFERDVILDSTGMSPQFRRALAYYRSSIFHVHLMCDEAAWRSRESQRIDRTAHLSPRVYARSRAVHFAYPPNLLIDTTDILPDVVAKRIGAAISEGRISSHVEQES